MPSWCVTMHLALGDEVALDADLVLARLEARVGPDAHARRDDAELHRDAAPHVLEALEQLAAASLGVGEPRELRARPRARSRRCAASPARSPPAGSRSAARSSPVSAMSAAFFCLRDLPGGEAEHRREREERGSSACPARAPMNARMPAEMPIARVFCMSWPPISAPRLFGRAAAGDEEAGGHRDEQRRDLLEQALADGEHREGRRPRRRAACRP